MLLIITQVTGTVTATHLTYSGWEYLPNGDFETGDFTDWDVGVYGTATATIVNDGDHGNVVQFYTDGDGSNLIYIAQYDIDTSNATGIKIDYNVILNGEYHYGENVSYGSLVLIIEPGYFEGGQIIYLDTSATIDWTSKEYTLEVPDENSKVAIQFYNDFSEPFSACIDNIVIHKPTSTCGVVLSATIEDNRKTWTADQFNTDGMFILTSGDVKGYSCTILDTFENYIQVPTTFANIINNIQSEVPTVYIFENQGFLTGDLEGWNVTIDSSSEYGTVIVGSIPSPPGVGTYWASLYHNTPDGQEHYWTEINNDTLNIDAYPTNVSFWCKVIDLEFDGRVVVNVFTDSSTVLPATSLILRPGEVDNLWNYYTLDIPENEEYKITKLQCLAYIYFFDYEYGKSNFMISGFDFGDSVFGTHYTSTYTPGDTYLITYTPTEWLTATATIFTFNTECGKNATTLGNINYGDGGLTLEFVENIGTYTGLTWTINKDVFFADVNQDYSRIASVICGKGSKLCGGAVYSYIADNTYSLTVSTIGDTFLRAAATAGANKIYVYDNTHFGTAYGYGSNFSLIVGHGETQEWLEISATGANGECTILPYGTTSYAHSVLEDVMNQGCFYATGSKEEVDNFMLALENTWMGYNWQNLSVFIGSEIVYLNCDNGTPYVRLNDNTVKMFMETLWRDDSYGYAYPHAPGAPVVAAVYFGGGLQNPDSLMARYGYREAHVNPVGIVDPDSMDKLCYNSLMSGTANGTWGKVMMPATLLPATVDIGDWVNIEEADQSATACYQIVGLEYDQSKGRFWIELGSTEDYYLESIAGNRGTFDLSLSNY